MHPMELLDVAHVESCFGLFEDIVSVGTRMCMVCTKQTIGSENILDAPMVLLVDKAQLEGRFSSSRDSVSVGAR
jgi:hypothetical protein